MGITYTNISILGKALQNLPKLGFSTLLKNVAYLQLFPSLALGRGAVDIEIRRRPGFESRRVSEIMAMLLCIFDLICIVCVLSWNKSICHKNTEKIFPV
jgi:hypothetical protein